MNSQPADLAFGQTLRERRRRLGLTLQQVADACGCTKAYLSTVETGRSGRPSAGILDTLEQVLGYAKGELVKLAYWTAAPEPVVETLRQASAALAENARLRRAAAKVGVDLDAALRSGQLESAARDRPGSAAELLDALRAGGNNLPDRKANDQAGDAPGRSPASAGDAQPIRPVTLPAVNVPVINSVAAGYPAWRTDLDYPAGIADCYVAIPGLSDPNAFAAEVVGDSMAPRYAEGDVVVFAPNADVLEGDDCFVRLETGETTFKRVFFPAEGRIRLVALNPHYGPRELDREEVNGLWRAVRRIEMLRRVVPQG